MILYKHKDTADTLEIILYYFDGIFNIVTDWLVFVLPTLIVWNVQIGSSQRWTVIAVFAIKPVYGPPLEDIAVQMTHSAFR